MSRLRQNLQNAKRDYEAARYPGDLAGDIARRKASGGVSAIIGRSIVAAAAIAALIIVGMIIWPAINRHAETTVPIVMNDTGASPSDEQPVTLSLASIDVPSWGDVATPASENSDADVVLTLASASGESDSLVPSFPSIDDIDTASVDDTLNNQETR